MSKRKNLHTSQELWSYFRSVIEWTESVFTRKRSQMKGLPWGLFYNKHHERTDLDPVVIEEQVNKLIADRDVEKKKGVYEYILTGDERCLSIRQFDEDVRIETYEKQNGICPYCGEHYELSEMHADHILAWSKGGHTTPDNCQMLCRDCNLKKSDK